MDMTNAFDEIRQPKTKRSSDGLHPGGSSEGISFDKNGMMNLSQRKGMPYKSSESMTSNIDEYQKDKKQRNTLQQQMGGY